MTKPKTKAKAVKAKAKATPQVVAKPAAKDKPKAKKAAINA